MHKLGCRRQREECKNMRCSVTHTVACRQQAEKRFQNILTQLSVYPKTDLDNVKKGDSIQKVSSPEEAINIPASPSEFCQLLRRKITQKSIHSIYYEDQEVLMAVIMSELSLIWQEVCRLPSDPTLTLEENKQLHGRTFIEVLRFCEELCLHYLSLLDTLGRRALFSHQANRSRVAAHMAADISSLLNVRSIRRSVAVGIKALRNGRLSAQKLRDGQQKALQIHRDGYPSKANICYSLIRECVARRPEWLHLEHKYDVSGSDLEPTADQKDTCCNIVSALTKAKEREELDHFTRLKGYCSMPDLQRETLLEELESIPLPAQPQSPLVLLSTDQFSNTEQEKNIDPAEDLKRLLQDTDPVDRVALAVSERDLPPLIRAMTNRGSSRLRELTLLLQRLDKEEAQKMKSQAEVAKPQHPQAEAVDVKVSSQGTARTAPSRVSGGVLPLTINMNPYPPIYNYLTGEIEASSWLDRNLFVGAEIKEVFKELSRDLPTQYLDFIEDDPLIEPAISSVKPVKGLQRMNHDKKLMNPSRQGPYLYCRGISYSSKRTENAAPHKRPEDVTSQAYAIWYTWWKSELSFEDFLSYISDQESDYLSAVFHLYDSNDSSEEEERSAVQLQRDKEKKHQKKINILRSQKQDFVPGLWYINAVLLGGLGKEPSLDELEKTDGEIQHVLSGVQGTVEDYKMPTTRCVQEEQIQIRLERIWTMLSLSEAQRLDMAIKYSSNAYRDKIEEATAAWEQAAQLIVQREMLLSQLEQLERTASDPNRFFQQGFQGSSTARMVESSHREKLLSQIGTLDKQLSKNIHHISVTFNDTVTYKGRPYGEKMRWDRIEMLYSLQQERRVETLEKLLRERGSLSDKLPSLSASHNTDLSIQKH